jgi:hypothetical protein
LEQQRVDPSQPITLRGSFLSKAQEHRRIPRLKRELSGQITVTFWSAALPRRFLHQAVVCWKLRNLIPLRFRDCKIGNSRE